LPSRQEGISRSSRSCLQCLSVCIGAFPAHPLLFFFFLTYPAYITNISIGYICNILKLLDNPVYDYVINDLTYVCLTLPKRTVTFSSQGQWRSCCVFANT